MAPAHPIGRTARAGRARADRGGGHVHPRLHRVVVEFDTSHATLNLLMIVLARPGIGLHCTQDEQRPIDVALDQTQVGFDDQALTQFKTSFVLDDPQRLLEVRPARRCARVSK